MTRENPSVRRQGRQKLKFSVRELEGVFVCFLGLFSLYAVMRPSLDQDNIWLFIACSADEHIGLQGRTVVQIRSRVNW